MVWIMLRIIVALIGRRIPSGAAGRAVRPRLETLEDRLAPSTLPLSGGDGIVQPETPVPGYKWRRPRPWVSGEGGERLQAIPSAGSSAQAATRLSTSAVVADILFGGADGPQGQTNATGPVVLRPEGPLPTDAVLTVR
jgi:hypothetical protein